MLKLQQTIKAAIFSFAAVSCALSAQDKRPVAILDPFTTGPVTLLNKNVVMSNMNSTLVNTGIYKVVDRKQQGVERPHLSDPRMVKRLGRLLGAELICVADLIKEGGYLNAKLSIIDVESGVVANAAQKLITRDDPESIDKSIKEAMAELLGIKTPSGQIDASGGQRPPIVNTPPNQPERIDASGGQRPPTGGASPSQPQKGSQKLSGLEGAISSLILNDDMWWLLGQPFDKNNFKIEVDVSAITLNETMEPGRYSVSGYIKIKMINLINSKHHTIEFKINSFTGTDMDIIKGKIIEQVRPKSSNIFNTLYRVIR